MLDIFKAAVLGIVEGVTEFLPISSTGHLILLNQWWSFSTGFTVLFDIFIQLGAVLAVVVYFWKKLWPFGGQPGHTRATLNLWLKALVGVVPAIILGALFGRTIEDTLFNPLTVALALVVGGIILILVEHRRRQASLSSVSDISLSMALYIGLAQCLALIPGTSRSAATMVGAMLLGASRAVAVEFSFFLAIPTMAAAAAYSVWKHGLAVSTAEAVLLGVGFVTSFLVALMVIRLFLRYVQRYSFVPFGGYRIALGILVVLLLGFGTTNGGATSVSQPVGEASPKDATYLVSGAAVTLVNGVAQKQAVSGSASNVTTMYFGNEARGDLNGDGVPDVAFLLIQDGGGSGTFYYAAVALKTATGYQGTNAVLLGDRIAPQSTVITGGGVIVNYAERQPGQSMSARPSVGVSKYLRITSGHILSIVPAW